MASEIGIRQKIVVFIIDIDGTTSWADQEDLSGREEVYSLMGYSIFSSKALFFSKKCQFCYISGKVAWMNKNSDRSGTYLNSKFRRGFLGVTIFLLVTVIVT